VLRDLITAFLWPSFFFFWWLWCKKNKCVVVSKWNLWQTLW